MVKCSLEFSGVGRFAPSDPTDDRFIKIFTNYFLVKTLLDELANSLISHSHKVDLYNSDCGGKG